MLPSIMSEYSCWQLWVLLQIQASPEPNRIYRKLTTMSMGISTISETSSWTLKMYLRSRKPFINFTYIVWLLKVNNSKFAKKRHHSKDCMTFSRRSTRHPKLSPKLIVKDWNKNRIQNILNSIGFNNQQRILNGQRQQKSLQKWKNSAIAPSSLR